RGGKEEGQPRPARGGVFRGRHVAISVDGPVSWLSIGVGSRGTQAFTNRDESRRLVVCRTRPRRYHRGSSSIPTQHSSEGFPHDHEGPAAPVAPRPCPQTAD